MRCTRRAATSSKVRETKKECERTRKSLPKYLQGHLFKLQERRVERHLKACAVCTSELQSLMPRYEAAAEGYYAARGSGRAIWRRSSRSSEGFRCFCTVRSGSADGLIAGSLFLRDRSVPPRSGTREHRAVASRCRGLRTGDVLARTRALPWLRSRRQRRSTLRRRSPHRPCSHPRSPWRSRSRPMISHRCGGSTRS